MYFHVFDGVWDNVGASFEWEIADLVMVLGESSCMPNHPVNKLDSLMLSFARCLEA